MKKLIILTSIAAVLMLGAPGLALLLPGLDAMGAIFLLFFAVNPLFAVVTGAISGRDIKRMWPLPIITPLSFLGSWLIYEMGDLEGFLIYSVGYLLIGGVTMLISALITRSVQKHRKDENERE